MNYFRCPTVMGPGKARQWGLAETFNDLTNDIETMFTGRGTTAVTRVKQWIARQDRPRDNAWHAITHSSSRTSHSSLRMVPWCAT
eukprot:8510155-Pyramimonas_sp.AAC.1